MSTALVVVGWIACAYVTYRLFEVSWLRSWDLERTDRRLFVGMSLLGPFMLLAGVIVYLLERPVSERGREVVKERRG